MTCVCNNCGAEIQINILETVLDDDKEDMVTEQYFVCLRCGARYTVCIFDNYMRKRIEMRKRLSKSKYNRKRDEQLKRETQNHFNELKKRYGRE